MSLKKAVLLRPITHACGWYKLCMSSTVFAICCVCLDQILLQAQDYMKILQALSIWSLKILKDFMDSSLPLISSKLLYSYHIWVLRGLVVTPLFEPFNPFHCGIKWHLPGPRVIQIHLYYTKCDPVMNQTSTQMHTSQVLPMKTLNASYLAGRAKEVRTSRNQNHKFKLSGIWNYFTESYILTAHSPNTLRCWHFHPD